MEDNMTVGELGELLKDKRDSMKIVIVVNDNGQKLYDLVGEDSTIRGGAPTFYFLEAKKDN